MEAPCPISINEKISQTIFIMLNNTKYSLHLNSYGDIISFSLDYNSKIYTKKISLKEIKDKELQAIFYSHSVKDFIEYLKVLSEMKKKSLIINDTIIIIKFEVEIMFKKHEVEIELINIDKSIELIQNELKTLKINYNQLNEENKNSKINYNKLNEENNDLKKRIENLEIEIKEIKK